MATIEIKQSTAVTFLLGPFVDKTDGVAVETGLATAMDNATTGIRVSKNGGNMADRNDATAPVHDEDGFYTIVLSTTDTDTLGHLQVEYTEVATALPAWMTFSVVTANYWDTKYGADVFTADLTQMGGVAQSATDLKDFADAGYNPATNKVTGVLLTDTVTTLTGHTAQTADHTAAIADIPTVAEFDARTILSASYFDPAADTVALVTTTTNLTTNNDKTGYALSAAGVDAIWDETLAGHVTADTTGLLLNDWQNAGRLDLILDIIAADVVNLDGMASLAATDIVSAGAITTLSGAIVNVDLVDLCTTTTTNTDVTALNDVAATDIVSAGAITTLSGAIVNVDLCDLTTTTTTVTNDVGITATAVNLIWDEAMVETTGAPAITGSFRLGLEWMFALSRNKFLQTATLATLRNDADGADLATRVVADNGTTYTANEWST